ncbi:MAG: ice-binding family protein [Bacteroidota bacterium]|nr:ice-binding family protein [Bacteroidota bacterium]
MKSTIKILLTKFVFQKILVIIILLIINTESTFGQYPQLGRSWSFGVFTTVGAIYNTGNTVINNDVGTDAGAINGFPPGIIIGDTHNADSVSNIVKTDINDLYSYLSNLTCDSVLAVGLGNNQILTPNVYCIGAASTLTDTLILDAQGDSNALFIFQINGAFTSATYSYISLINSAKPCNVFWQVNGLIELGDFTYFNGTAVAAGAITLLDGAELEGRIFSIPGAINLNNNYINIPCTGMYLSEKNSKIRSFCNNGKINLNWSGNSEKTIYYIVEKSSDKINWIRIGKVTSTNNLNTQNYSLEVNINQNSENTFYRVKQYDQASNMFVLGEIRMNNNCNTLKQNIQLYPNPANNYFQVLLNGNEDIIDNISIFNSLGKKIYHNSSFNGKVNVKDFKNGIYYIHILYNNQYITSKLRIENTN